jgi:hypothetical protein
VRRLCFRCTRCAGLRYEAWSAVTGELLFRDYRYPDDWAHLTREDGMRADMRVEWIRRLGTATKAPTRRSARVVSINGGRAAANGSRKSHARAAG